MDNPFILNAVIVDDERRGISILRLLIQNFIENVKVVADCTQPAEAVALIESLRPEIVFLDIDMPGMNGFEMLDRLAWKNFSLVFTTAHQEYGLRALKNNAVDYLLKPIHHHELAATVNKIRARLSENRITVSFNYRELFDSLSLTNRPRLLVNTLSGIEHIDPEAIVYLESQSNYTRVVLSDEPEVITRKTLKEFELQLCRIETEFMRVHHSYIVRLSKVTRYVKGSDEIILSNGAKVPLSKSRREAFFQWLNI